MIRIQWKYVGDKYIGKLCGEEIATIICHSPTDWEAYLFKRRVHGFISKRKAKTLVKKELTDWLNKIFAVSVDTRRIEF